MLAAIDAAQSGRHDRSPSFTLPLPRLTSPLHLQMHRCSVSGGSSYLSLGTLTTEESVYKHHAAHLEFTLWPHTARTALRPHCRTVILLGPSSLVCSCPPSHGASVLSILATGVSGCLSGRHLEVRCWVAELTTLWTSADVAKTLYDVAVHSAPA